MRKLAAILLLSILSFNWYGYRLLSNYLENTAETRIEAQIDDNQYDDSQLISIKAPAVHMGYYNNTTEFQRARGQVEVGGILYNFVKHRIHNDSLEYLCIPNHPVMQIQKAKIDFFQRVNDLNHNGQEKNRQGNSKGPFTPDYLMASALDVPPGILDIESKRPKRTKTLLPSTTLSPADRPPDAIFIA